MTAYTISMLQSDLVRRDVQRIFVTGILGRVEIPKDMLDSILYDSLGCQPWEAPDTVSPWLLTIDQPGIGLLSRNPRMGRGRVAIVGWVRMRSDREGKAGAGRGGHTQARAIYRGRKASSDTPLKIRIQSTRSRRKLKLALRDLLKAVA